MGAADRLRAWLVAGPVGRFLAFVLDLAAALAAAARGAMRSRRPH